MNLLSFENRRVRVMDARGNTFTGIAEIISPERGLRDYGRAEEGIKIGERVLFASDGIRVEPLLTCEEARASIPPGRYRHFKGNEYEVIDIARHSETEEPLVVYRALYGDFGLWVRPADMWVDTNLNLKINHPAASFPPCPR